MSHGNGEDSTTDSTVGVTPANAGESFAWLRAPAHAAPDPEAGPDAEATADPKAGPDPEMPADSDIELDAGLAIATDPEQYPPNPAGAPPDTSAGAMSPDAVSPDAVSPDAVSPDAVSPNAADAAAPVQYPIPPQDYDRPVDRPSERGNDRPQNTDQGYPPPTYERPNYEAPSPDQSNDQPPNYQPPNYASPGYASPNYASPNYASPNYEMPTYQAPNYQPVNYAPPTYEQRGYAAQPSQWSQSNTDPGLSAPAQQPPVQQPPVQQPPVQQPPVQQPPVQQPPVQQPPVRQQPRHADRGAPPAQQGQPPSHATPPPVPPPMPRPEDLLVPNRSPVTVEPASWGWRGKLNRGSGGLFKPKAAPAELSARQAIVDIQRSFSRPKTVVVVQPKGGAGKTPTAICLSAAFGAHRGGYVVGWDDNETRGTLAVRVANPDDQRATVWDLLSDLAAFERFDARVGDLSYYVRAQPDSHFDALVSDDNPGNMAQIGEDEFQRLHKVLQRFYRMIVVDTGNNVRSPNWQAAVNAADLVVVVSTYQRDVGYSGSWVLDHLGQTGREELARNAVTVLTAADPTTDKTVREQLIPHFTARTRAVAEIPYDPELAHGGPIRWSMLTEATRNAWIAAGATIVNALVEQDQRELAARRSIGWLGFASAAARTRVTLGS